jgi:hypothetical protein
MGTDETQIKTRRQKSGSREEREGCEGKSYFAFLRVLRAKQNLCFICVHLWLKLQNENILAHSETPLADRHHSAD